MLTCTSTWLGGNGLNGSEEKCPRNKVCGGASMLESRPGRTNLWETLRSMGCSPRTASDTVLAGLTFTAEVETQQRDGWKWRQKTRKRKKKKRAGPSDSKKEWCR